MSLSIALPHSALNLGGDVSPPIFIERGESNAPPFGRAKEYLRVLGGNEWQEVRNQRKNITPVMSFDIILVLLLRDILIMYLDIKTVNINLLD